ncbi:MAG: hypothetical protein AB1815_13535 [Bacillota bacterium]
MLHLRSYRFITELIRPKTPASAGGGFQRGVKSSMNSTNIQSGLNPPLNEVSFNCAAYRPSSKSWALSVRCTWARL